MRKALFFACFVTGSALAQNPGGMRPTACTAGLDLPDGFCATVFAESVNTARHIVVAPNGDVFVNTGGRGGSGGGVIAFRDTNRDGKADLRERFGGDGGTGIALD